MVTRDRVKSMASRAPSTLDHPEVKQKSATHVFPLLLGNTKLASLCTFILLSKGSKMARVLLHVCVLNYLGDLAAYSPVKFRPL